MNPLSERDPLKNAQLRQHLEAVRRDQTHVATQPLEIGFQEWDGSLERRRIRVAHRGLTFECFGTPSHNKRLVVFLSPGGGALKSGNNPRFTRWRWHPYLDAVAVSIDDPTFAAFPGQLSTGWYLGSVDQDAVPPTAELITKIAKRYGVGAEDVYVMGSSAGGTAALKIVNALPGATAIAENPPFVPHDQPTVRHFDAAGLELRRGGYFERNDLAHIVEHPSSRFVVLQNWNDGHVLKQMNAFLSGAGLPALRLGWHEWASLAVYGCAIPSISPHHAFLSVEEFVSLLEALSAAVTADTRSALLDAIYIGARARILAEDTISNLKGWSRLSWELRESPLEFPVHDFEQRVITVPLQGASKPVYRLRMFHEAAHVAISLELENAGPLSLRAAEAARAAGANLSKRGDVQVLSLWKIPMSVAAEKIRAFVAGTAVLHIDDAPGGD